MVFFYISMLHSVQGRGKGNSEWHFSRQRRLQVFSAPFIFSFALSSPLSHSSFSFLRLPHLNDLCFVVHALSLSVPLRVIQKEKGEMIGHCVLHLCEDLFFVTRKDALELCRAHGRDDLSVLFCNLIGEGRKCKTNFLGFECVKKKSWQAVSPRVGYWRSNRE